MKYRLGDDKTKPYFFQKFKNSNSYFKFEGGGSAVRYGTATILEVLCYYAIELKERNRRQSTETYLTHVLGCECLFDGKKPISISLLLSSFWLMIG